MKIKKSETGFTIPELLTTLFVLSIAFFSFTTLFLTILTINERSSNLLTANAAAFAKMQQYENTDFLSIPTGTGPDYQVENFTASLPNSLVDAQGTVVSRFYVDPGTMVESSTLKVIEVTVTFRSGQNQDEIIYTNYIQISGVSS